MQEGMTRCMAYLVVDIGGPEASNSTFVWVGRKEGGTGAFEGLFDVLHDDL